MEENSGIKTDTLGAQTAPNFAEKKDDFSAESDKETGYIFQLRDGDTLIDKGGIAIITILEVTANRCKVRLTNGNISYESVDDIVAYSQEKGLTKLYFESDFTEIEADSVDIRIGTQYMRDGILYITIESDALPFFDSKLSAYVPMRNVKILQTDGERVPVYMLENELKRLIFMQADELKAKREKVDNLISLLKSKNNLIKTPDESTTQSIEQMLARGNTESGVNNE